MSAKGFLNDRVYTTLTHEGKIAPKGKVFAVAKVTYQGVKKIEHSASALIDRQGVDDEVIGQFLSNFKKQFLQKLIK